MEDTMNRLWHGFTGSPSGDGAEDWNILIDVIERKDDIEVKASVPGAKTEAIEVTVEDNVLTIRADRESEAVAEGEAYLIRERPIGRFYRALRLPDTVDTDKIQSNYDSGILTITMPKAEEKKKKKIEIKVTGQTKAIEGKK
jgi:HSP20 family protein